MIFEIKNFQKCKQYKINGAVVRKSIFESTKNLYEENAALKSKLEDSEEECGNHENNSAEYANAAQMWENKAGELKDDNAALRSLAQRAISFLSVNGIYSDDLQEELKENKE